MRKILKTEFFNRPTPQVAEALLGKFLVRRIGRRESAVMITEVEVYDGFKDKGSHASRGKTPRNLPMFGRAGQWYIYFTYGRHWMLNLVTREKDYPAAILIRGVLGTNGPARLTKKLQIDKKLNGLPTTRKSGLWVEDREVKIPKSKIKKTGRIGIAYAGSYWAKRKWRFVIESDKLRDLDL